MRLPELNEHVLEIADIQEQRRKITSNIRRVFQNKSWGAESDFFFHPKNSSKGRLSQRSGISTFIRGLSLCSFSVSNNLRGYSEACFIRSGTHTPRETLRLWWIQDLRRRSTLSKPHSLQHKNTGFSVGFPEVAHSLFFSLLKEKEKKNPHEKSWRN